MRKSRFTEAQIIQILAENDAGTPTDELARRNGIHLTPFGCGVRKTRA
jgi:hypothetical protein